MQEDSNVFLELMGNLHFQQILYRISIILLLVITIGTIFYHDSILSTEYCYYFQDACNCHCDFKP